MIIPSVLLFIAYQLLSCTAFYVAPTSLSGEDSHHSLFMYEKTETQSDFFPKGFSAKL